MRKEFKGKLKAVEGAWTFLKVPFNVAKVFGSRARVSVRGTLNGFPFRSSLFPDGRGHHTMMVNKAMQQGARARPGDTVKVVMEPDTASRVVSLPAALKKALAKSKRAKAFFEKLAYSHRKPLSLGSRRTSGEEGLRVYILTTRPSWAATTSSK